jgi:DNA-binding beta-propeller fold protein YncE
MIRVMSRALTLAVLACCLWLGTAYADDQASSPAPAPSGIAVDTDGNVYVSDYALDRVVKFAPDGTVLIQFGGSGNGPGEFSGPFGIAVDAANDVFVVDQLNGRVQRFSSDGTVSAWGAPGAGPGELRTPFGIAVSAGRAYVADFGNDRVQEFAFDGTPLGSFGTRGTGDGQFQRPAAVAIGSDGSLYVTDHFNDRVERFTGDGRFVAQVGAAQTSAQAVASPTATPAATVTSTATATSTASPTATLTPVPSASAIASASSGGAAPIAAIPSGTVTDAQLRRPEGIVVDRDGNLWIADYGRDRVVKLSPDGRLLQSWGSRGGGPGEFVGPKGVAIDPTSGRLYVADTGNSRVQRLAADGTVEATWPMPQGISSST